MVLHPAVNHPKLLLWRDMAQRLTPYSIDTSANDTGFMVGEGMPLAHGHRHFSYDYFGALLVCAGTWVWGWGCTHAIPFSRNTLF